MFILNPYIGIRTNELYLRMWSKLINITFRKTFSQPMIFEYYITIIPSLLIFVNRIRYV